MANVKLENAINETLKFLVAEGDVQQVYKDKDGNEYESLQNIPESVTEFEPAFKLTEKGRKKLHELP